MTARGGAYKTGLDRRILDTAPSAFLSLLKSQAEETGLQWMEVPTRQVQPSQTYHRCGGQRKKPLSERRHGGDCGANCSRDENAAKVILNWALTGSATGQELTEAWSGGSSAVSKCKTPAVLAQPIQRESFIPLRRLMSEPGFTEGARRFAARYATLDQTQRIARMAERCRQLLAQSRQSEPRFPPPCSAKPANVEQRGWGRKKAPRKQGFNV